MARTRRRKRSSSQRIAGLVALGLPAPMQRVADTRLGSLMMLIFIPAMIISGVLTVDWKNGTPSLNLNRNKAEELKQKATNGLNQWNQDGTLQNWQNNVERAWQQAQNNFSNPQNSGSQSSWQPQHPAWQPKDQRSFPSTSPATNPGGFVNHTQPAQQSQATWNPQGTWASQGAWNSASTIPQQPIQNSQPIYGQPNAWPSGYNTESPTFNNPSTNYPASTNTYPGATTPVQGGNYSYPTASQTNNYQPYYGNTQPANGNASGNWLR